MDDWCLAAAVCDIRVVAAVKQEEHHRSRAKVKRHTIAYMEAGTAIDWQLKPPFLDIIHPDPCAGIPSLHHDRVTVEAAISYDRWETINVYDVVDFRMSGSRHRLPFGRAALRSTGTAVSPDAPHR